MALDLAGLRPGDELVVTDTSNGGELRAFYRSKLPNGMLNVYIERFANVMRFREDGITSRGRFKITQNKDQP